jgi:hypothetical protein
MSVLIGQARQLLPVLDELGSEVLPHFPTRSPSPDLDRSVRQEGEQQPLPVP